MALIMPLLDRLTRRMPDALYLFTVFGFILLAQGVIVCSDAIPVAMVRFGVNEIVPYAVGYSALAVLGLRLPKLTQLQLRWLASIALASILILTGMNDRNFTPQAYKYPPRGLYLLYGVFASTVLWMFKPVLVKFTDTRIFGYLSRNSMWIYLWHIIPVYALAPWMELPGMWFGRYIIVLFVAILLNLIYQTLLNLLPPKLSNPLG